MRFVAGRRLDYSTSWLGGIVVIDAHDIHASFRRDAIVSAAIPHASLRLRGTWFPSQPELAAGLFCQLDPIGNPMADHPDDADRVAEQGGS